MHSLRIRLKEFRKIHYTIATTTLVLLVLNFALFSINKYIYLFLENPKKHFAYDFHIAKELALKLSELGINKVSTDDKKMGLRLKFYGIEYGKDFYITSGKAEVIDKKIPITYNDKVISTYFLVDLSTKTEPIIKIINKRDL